MQYGCIGEHLSHSMSVEVHRAIADESVGEYEYKLCELSENQLDGFFSKLDFEGINITIPYKQKVIKYLDYIDENARKIGAVNTVVVRDGKLYGYNTDFDGMKALIFKGGFDFSDANVLVLGSGGTSRTAYYVSLALGAKSVVRVSRNPSGECISYAEMYEKHADADFVINTTPVGMFGAFEDGIPIELDRFPKLRGIVDAVYNPIRTRLVLNAQNRGIKAVGGLYMLVSQAVAAAEKFFDRKLDGITDKVYAKILSQAQNIVLVGMPGCGKSTVGKLISEKLGCGFFDTDTEIESFAGCKIPEIFEKDGEKAFRHLEKQIIRDKIRNLHGCVVATGGGSVLNPENVEMLKQNGKVVFIDRPTELITSTDGRPLLKNRTLKDMYEQRYPIYKSSADITIDNNATIDKLINTIMESFR